MKTDHAETDHTAGCRLPEAPGLSDLYVALVAQMAAGLPRLPDGRIDYTGAPAAAVVNCIIRRGDGRILLVRRSARVGDHHGRWAGITGYIDRLQPVDRIARDEIAEETGLGGIDIGAVTVARPHISPEPAAGRTFITFITLAEAVTSPVPPIRLNWEADGHMWADPGDLRGLDLIPGQARIITQALALRRDGAAIPEPEPEHPGDCPGGCDGTGAVMVTTVWDDQGDDGRVPLGQEPRDCPGHGSPPDTL